MLPAFASPDDLAVRLGVTFDAAGEARAQAALDDVSALIRQAAGVAVPPADWVTDPEGAGAPDVVRLVAITAALRMRRNYVLDGARSTSADGYSEQYDGGTLATPELTDAELATIRTVAGVKGKGVVSVPLEGDYPAPVLGYVPVTGPGATPSTYQDPFPLWPSWPPVIE